MRKSDSGKTWRPPCFGENGLAAAVCFSGMLKPKYLVTSCINHDPCPNIRCIVHVPTFTIKFNPNVGKYISYTECFGWEGSCTPLIGSTFISVMDQRVVPIER